MKYSKATDYALHTMVLLGEKHQEPPISVVELTESQNISPTYLSKILTKLSKEGLVKATSGANGGYSIRNDWEMISFLDIIQAIEGNNPFLNVMCTTIQNVSLKILCSKPNI